MPRFRLHSALAAIILAIPSVLGAPVSNNDTVDEASKFSLIAEYSGSNFFDHFTTFTGSDPTFGDVDYVDMATAHADKLIRFKTVNGNAHAIIGVDHSQVAPSGRKSVRLLSKNTFSAGTLSILDVRHIPVQWGVWPAVWFLGNLPGGVWPGTNGGEMDWLEWVHESPYNSVNLHTGPGCSVRNASASFQGTLLNTNCNAGAGSDGCSIAAYRGDASPSHPQPLATAGHAFNAAGGAVYAHLWEPSGVTVWMFPHDNLPRDLASSAPEPHTWTQFPPLARFEGRGCDFTKALRDMQLIINIDFCGSWAGQPGVWQSSGAAAATGIGSCSEYVSNHPGAFANTYFEIAALKFYSTGAAAGLAT